MAEEELLHNTLVQIKALEDFNQTLKSNNKELEAYIRVMEEYVYTTKTNTQGIITDVTDSFCRLTGYDSDELIGQTHNIIRDHESDDETFQELWEKISKGGIWEGNLKSLRKDGTHFWMQVVIFPRYNSKKEIIGYSSIRHNITASKKLEEEVIRDGLTGLFNRRYYDEVIEHELMRAKRDKLPFTFVMMDIDFFKPYNDTYGHREGDNVLKKIAKLLKKMLSRGGDFCFRLGGEEFGFFFAGESLEESIKHTQKICKAIEELHIPHSKNKASKYVTASFGLINIDTRTTIIDEHAIYVATDTALYKAKESGRNRVVVHDIGEIELF